MSSNRPELKFSAPNDERGFYNKFISLPEKPDTTIRISDRGDYYTVVGFDAVFVADTVYHTQSVLKNCNLDHGTSKRFGSIPTQYATLSTQVVSTLLKNCLLELGYKVELYDKNWNLLKCASPGNIDQVEDLMNIAVDSPIILASLKLQLNSNDGNCVVGLAFIDAGNQKIGMLDIVDNEVYSNLESCLIQLGVRECLLPDLSKNEANINEIKKITSVLERCNCVATFIKNSEFQAKDVEMDLMKLLGNDLSLSLPKKFSNLALGACNALLNYLEILQGQDSLGKFELVEYSINNIMKLDASAVKALNLFPNNNAQSYMQSNLAASNGYSNSNESKISSLFQLLNNCKTKAGVRLLNEWLKQPLTDLAEINKRHDLVEFLIDQLELRETLQTNYLPSIPDVRRITKKLHKNGNLEDILKIYLFSKKIPDILQLLESFLDGVDGTVNKNIQELVTDLWIDPIQKHIEPLSKFEEMVETTVDLEMYESHNEFMIKVEFNEELAKLRMELDQLRNQITTAHLEAAEDLGFDTEKKLKLENHHLHGWCMRLTRNDAKELRKHKKYIELSTVKAGIYFSTRELKEVAKETAILQKEYEKQQSALVREIVGITLTYTPVLEKLSLVLANQDVLCSFAHASSYAPIPYIRPTMHSLQDTGRKTILKGSRHPVLEVQDDLTFISNDISLEKGSSDFLIITGPNMGGKSTYIRQIGVISLMAQIGCFVPCDEAEISVVDAILCRVGAGDSQLKGVSTFMVEMLETSSILKNATPNSLIIVDELGRGTSTYDGFGLAWAISEHVASKIGCFTLFATHFHELTSLEKKLDNVKNLHVVAHIGSVSATLEGNNSTEDITLLFKVEPGISDQSFGIHVAEVVQFPEKIVKMAKRKANELEDLKNTNKEVKKLKLSPQEMNEGNEKLRTLLKNWVKQCKEEGLDKPENITSEAGQKKIQELLRDMSKESESSNNQFIECITKMLL
ncbi:hypothetical protein TPHA_0A00740 [Tetrapisispora phaffii CBS 4417]|uniref:DNA mismatch repair protein MSH2 n=1 Tax=Tetrapisispora phaffii (strain ATCC 24235 / CBS 4417 / NBRC 1672 / NRRL Y-8282 / UCD 70-5) TaxID=1071381 RepID=G8BMN1_TETPH|nr:hypothetical protein TPHA_0A00740 [Tetrapisispora phaffii CBS 4417]CCE61159.1 hypothetical protein TPHA_0A00740 [Tetrapisispora phaffii CBS 4417]